MSYELYFWRQTKDTPLSPLETMNLLSTDQPVEGISSFPRSEVRAVLREYFPEIEDGDSELTWKGDGSYFQISFAHPSDTEVHMIIANCGYELIKGQNAVNRLIEACTGFGCALYDPQTNERYQQPEPRTGGQQ